jgi:hypothetical protein
MTTSSSIKVKAVGRLGEQAVVFMAEPVALPLQ